LVVREIEVLLRAAFFGYGNFQFGKDGFSSTIVVLPFCFHHMIEDAGEAYEGVHSWRAVYCAPNLALLKNFIHPRKDLVFCRDWVAKRKTHWRPGFGFLIWGAPRIPACQHWCPSFGERD